MAYRVDVGDDYNLPLQSNDKSDIDINDNTNLRVVHDDRKSLQVLGRHGME